MFSWNFSRWRIENVSKPKRPSARTGGFRLRNRPGSIGGRRDPAPDEPVAEQIRAFLVGRTNGETLLRALYDPILDEPVPARLRRLLQHRGAPNPIASVRTPSRQR